ncbi:hypothetical protein PCANC_24988 [Puccinia coronata f. sp. avenae]|uniref:No apical meristem-associated C-terminal domain-containing protein n=1 Tax=Puccinia coronata f. sp. avenae TaxID=200324 RepID=A0A2N5TQL8_9BASI|nr:hypothetical protein PCANC_24988 [Puccinia coronata f. sp. avenae]
MESNIQPNLDLSQLDRGNKEVPVEPKANQKKAKNESKSMRQQNYTDAEDVQLCNLWLNVAQDPVIGINRTGSGFWMRVAEKYLKSAQAASSNPGDSIDPLSKPTTNANSTVNKIKRPAGNKCAKLDQH